MPEKVRIRALTSFEDFEKLLHIQRTVWNHGEADLTPVHQFAVSSRMGAVLLGAFVGRELAGFVYAFPAVHDGKLCLHSHLLAVLPELQGYGLGKALKRAQREEALARGYDLITWTYDPLQTRNANLNLQALGAVSRTYFHNFYGLTPSLCLGPGIPTDRMLIEWPIRSARVKKRIAGSGKASRYDAAALPKALERRLEKTSGGKAGAGRAGTDAMPGSAPLFARPGRPKLNLKKPVVLVEVPKDIRALRYRPDLIAAWQKGLRRVMQDYFRRGYIADHFIYGDRCFYVLKKGRGGRKKG